MPRKTKADVTPAPEVAVEKSVTPDPVAKVAEKKKPVRKPAKAPSKSISESPENANQPTAVAAQKPEEAAYKNRKPVQDAEEPQKQPVQNIITIETPEEQISVDPLQSEPLGEDIITPVQVEPEEEQIIAPQVKLEDEEENGSAVKTEPDRKDNIREMEVDIRKLNNMNIKDLYTFAKKFNINGYTRLRKNELVFSILQAQAKSFGYFFNEGVLDVIPTEGYGFLRTGNLLPGNNEDIYVSQSQIRKFNLNVGDIVSGQVRAPKEGEKFFALLRIEAINYNSPDKVYDRVNFENLTPIYPLKKLKTEYDSQKLSTRIIDLFSPIGKGQRGLIVAQPKAGKTTLLKDIANGIAANHPETLRIVLLIDERPEEVTDITRSVDAQVVAAPFDMPPEKQIKVAQLTLQMAKRLVEYKYDVVILLDSITRLARAYNNYIPSSGKLLSGGVDPKALYGPKYFFGAARNIEEGGSLTIIATALVDTGSKMDEVIFEEFKGTGNMELVLSRQLSDRRIFPAINLQLSGTRREELLLQPEELRKVWILRKMLSSMNEEEGLNLILKKMKETSTNEFFLTLLDKEKSRY